VFSNLRGKRGHKESLSACILCLLVRYNVRASALHSQYSASN